MVYLQTMFTKQSICPNSRTTLSVKSLFVISWLSLLPFYSFSQLNTLSPHAQISVITFGPTQEELYSAFGHSGIRVYDSLGNLDLFFNYGVFNFNQPNFYLNFTRGHLLYSVDVYPYPAFREYYIENKRFVHEQLLNLTPAQAQKIFSFLAWNVQPENKDYLYDYFYNNCATKVRDVFEHVLNEDVAFDSTFIQTDYTIRQLTDLYLQQQPWGDLGIDICLGLPMDKKARPYEYMFLPDYIESSFDHATNQFLSLPLVKRKIVVFEPAIEKIPFQWFHPWVVFGLLLLAGAWITHRDWRRAKTSAWLDASLFFVCGVIGLLLLLLWTATDHKAAAKNFNLLWALPTHFILIFFLLKKGWKPKWLKNYFLVTTLIYALLLGFWFLLPQALSVYLIPFVCLLLMRSALNFLLLKRVSSAS